MRILIACIAYILTAVSAFGQVAEKLQEYLKAIDRQSTEIKCEEADFLIGTCTDSTIRQNVALTVYEHFLSSPVMGDEAVAIHVYDKWFADGTVQMKSEADLLEAKLFATVNRQSLIGCEAPEITLCDINGREITLSGNDGRYKVLYFYDTDCTKCRIESILLRTVLENDNFDIDIDAIYTGSDKNKWIGHIAGQLDFDAPKTNVTHLWDPEATSGMETKYGVIKTPRMFLVNPQGIIIGRELDTYALEQILTEIRALQELYSLAPIGEKLPKIKVPGMLLTKNKSREKKYRLDKIGEAVVIFHTEGCRNCEMEIAAARHFLQAGKFKKVLLVDMDTIFSSTPDTANEIIANFDLSSLPFILSADKGSCVVEKYISLIR